LEKGEDGGDDDNEKKDDAEVEVVLRRGLDRVSDKTEK
jgi:hypothetical protein